MAGGFNARFPGVSIGLVDMVQDIYNRTKTADDAVPPPPGAVAPPLPADPSQFGAALIGAPPPGAAPPAPAPAKRGGQNEMAHEIKSMRAEIFQLRKLLVSLFKAMQLPVPDEAVLGEHPGLPPASEAPPPGAAADAPPGPPTGSPLDPSGGPPGAVPMGAPPGAAGAPAMGMPPMGMPPMGMPPKTGSSLPFRMPGAPSPHQWGRSQIFGRDH